MALSQTLEAIGLLERWRTGSDVAAALRDRTGQAVEVRRVSGVEGSTEFLRMALGRDQTAEGTKTVGIVGRLGGVRLKAGGALVSDADGAIAAIASALALADRLAGGEELNGTVLVSTHIASEAPTIPHDPVPLVGSPVPMEVVNDVEITGSMDLVLSIDATKGNRIVNARGIAITPPVFEGWVLPVPPRVVDIFESVTGRPAVVIPLSTYDITPYGNGLPHLNSIVQPATASTCPVIGVATVAEIATPGIATGANRPTDIALAVQFCLEVARRFLDGDCSILDQEAFELAKTLYGPLWKLKGHAADDKKAQA